MIKSCIYYKKNKFPSKIGIFHFLGIGDWLLLKPAIEKLKKISPATKIYVFFNQEPSLVKQFVGLDKNIAGYSVYPDDSALKDNFKYEDKIFISNYTAYLPWAYCRKHIIQLYGRILGVGDCQLKSALNLTKKEEEFGLKFSKLFKNKMIVLYNDTSRKNKRWSTERWQRVIKEIHNYVFVQIGPSDGKPIKGAINMLGKTKLRQAWSLVKNSSLFVGIEGQFMHVANNFGIPSVILFSGQQNTGFLGYKRNMININKGKKRDYYSFYLPPNKKEKVEMDKSFSLIKVYEVVNAIKKIIKAKANLETHCYKYKIDKDVCLSCKGRDICRPENFRVRLSDLILVRYLPGPIKQQLKLLYI